MNEEMKIIMDLTDVEYKTYSIIRILQIESKTKKIPDLEAIMSYTGKSKPVIYKTLKGLRNKGYIAKKKLKKDMK